MRSRPNTRLFRATLLAFAGAVLTLAGDGAARAADRWVAIGPEGGTVVGLAFDAAGPRTVYAALDEAGVWRSDDGAASWVDRSSGLPPGTSRALAADPVAAGTLYLGRTDGVWKSVDGGVSWALVPLDPGVAGAEVRVLSIDPATHALWVSLIPAPFQTSLYRSLDGGGHWSPVEFGRPGVVVNALAFGGGDVYAGTPGAGVYRGSADGGSWSQVLAEGNVTSLAWGGGRLYATTESGLLASLDRGESWAVRIAPPPPSPQRPPTGLVLGAIALSPENPDLLVVSYRLQPGTLFSIKGLYRSTDGGRTHETLGGGFPDAESQALLFIPGPGGGLLAGPGTLGVWSSADGRTQWRSSHRGLRAAPVSRVLADPKRPGLLYAGVVGQGVLRTLNGGATWLPAHGAGKVLLPLALDPDQPATLYGFGLEEGVNILYKSRNGGRAWTRLLDGPLSFALDPRHPKTLFTGFAGGLSNPVRRSDDGGATWKEGTVSCTFPYYLALAPTGEVFTGGRSFCGTLGSEKGGADRSDDGGKTFANKREGLPGVPVPSSLVVDPRRPATLFGGFGGLSFVDGQLRSIQSLFRTRDRADHWEEVPSLARIGVPVVDLAFPPAGANAIWAATGGRGIWRSGDAGETFREIASPGLPTRMISDLEFDRRTPAVLYAATPGGLFRLARD